MGTLETKKVADVVTDNFQTAHIFKKYGIEFCCGGGVGIKRAAEKARVNYSDLENDLLKVENTTSFGKNYKDWDLRSLTNHIINVHHTYIRENIPLLKQYALAVVRAHKHHYPELIQVQRLLSVVAHKLSRHLNNEESILFPLIGKMISAEGEGTAVFRPAFETVGTEVAVMQAEHLDVGGIFRRIRVLSNNYTPPERACNIYKAFYARLEEFEQELHQHVHLENNILFPKAMELQKALSAR